MGYKFEQICRYFNQHIVLEDHYCIRQMIRKMKKRQRNKVKIGYVELFLF